MRKSLQYVILSLFILIPIVIYLIPYEVATKNIILYDDFGISHNVFFDLENQRIPFYSNRLYGSIEIDGKKYSTKKILKKV